MRLKGERIFRARCHHHTYPADLGRAGDLQAREIFQPPPGRAPDERAIQGVVVIVPLHHEHRAGEFLRPFLKRNDERLVYCAILIINVIFKGRVRVKGDDYGRGLQRFCFGERLAHPPRRRFRPALRGGIIRIGARWETLHAILAAHDMDGGENYPLAHPARVLDEFGERVTSRLTDEREGTAAQTARRVFEENLSDSLKPFAGREAAGAARSRMKKFSEVR